MSVSGDASVGVGEEGAGGGEESPCCVVGLGDGWGVEKEREKAHGMERIYFRQARDPDAFSRSSPISSALILPSSFGSMVFFSAPKKGLGTAVTHEKGVALGDEEGCYQQAHNLGVKNEGFFVKRFLSQNSSQ